MSESTEGPRQRVDGPSVHDAAAHSALTGGALVAGLAGLSMMVVSAWPTLTATPDPAAMPGVPSTEGLTLAAAEQDLAVQRTVGGVRAQESGSQPLADYRLGAEPQVLSRLPVPTATQAPLAATSGMWTDPGVGAVPGVTDSLGAALGRMTSIPASSAPAALPGLAVPAPAPDPAPDAPPTDAPEDPQTPGSGAPFSFRAASFNVLGSQHTAGSRRWASGTTRAARIPGLMAANGVDVAGFQEVQADQLAVLQRSLPQHTLWPGTSLGRGALRLQIAYRHDRFEAVGSGSVSTDFDHQRRPLPYLRLRERASGTTFWVVDVHNSPRGQEAQRDRATADQIALVRRLQQTGDPVVVVGDMNEKTEFFCRVGRATGLRAANGATTGSGGCRVPRRERRIDWVMGGGGSGADLAWSGFTRLQGPLVRSVSDHPLVYATARITRR